MSQKKTDGSSSTAKRKGSASGRGSARSATAKSPTGTKRRSNVVLSPTLSEIGMRIKKAKSLHELAACMYFLRDAGTTVKIFDFEADARFYDLIQTGQFKKARKLAQDRFSTVSKAGGKIVPFDQQLGVRKAYSAALHKQLLTKKMPRSTRELIMTQLKHALSQPKVVKTPFDSEAQADLPFDKPEASAKMKGSKRRV